MPAGAGEFDDLSLSRKTVIAGETRQRGVERLRRRLLDMAAVLADQKHDLVTLRMPMRAGNESIEAFKPVDEAVFFQEIERAVDGDRRRAARAVGPKRFDKIVGTEWTARPCERIENGAPLRREAEPLASAVFLGGIEQAFRRHGMPCAASPFRVLVRVRMRFMGLRRLGHGCYIKPIRPSGETGRLDIALQNARTGAVFRIGRRLRGVPGCR